MARVLTTKDAYSIINAIAKEATGQQATLQAVDSSTFVSVGETVLAAGTENVLNALALVLGRTMVAVRPYNARFKLITVDDTIYANRMRKISFYAKDAVIDGASNTDLKTNFADGYDNGTNSGTSTASMWEQHQKYVLELNFGGASEWQYCVTIYEKQLQAAFRNEADFMKFISGLMTEVGNDLETQKEAFARMTLLNWMAGVYDLSDNNNGAVINLTYEFNQFYGTSYTTAQLLSTYLSDFLAFFASTVKTVSRKMENRSVKYHWPVPKTVGAVLYNILRHTPRSKQKMFMLADFWEKAEALVKPAVFNPQYLDINNFEVVDFWQNENVPASIKVTPAIPNTSSPSEQKAGSQVSLTNVLGCIFDSDALMIQFQLEDAVATPREARKHYHNIWHTIKRNAINDFSEKGVIFIMADPTPSTKAKKAEAKVKKTEAKAE